jgi:hypothetical protein
MRFNITAILVLLLLPISAQAQQPDVDKVLLSFDPQLVQALLTSDALRNPEKLRKIAGIAGAHGMTKEMVYFSGLAKQLTRKAEVNTFQSLILGDVDSAIDAARLSGRPFADRPVKVKPNDPNDYTWKIQYEGSSEAVVNARSVFDMYSQIAQSEGYNFTRELSGLENQQALDKERKERKELMEEQRRALQTNELLTLRFLNNGGGISPLPQIGGYGHRGY